jgi:hypothetical protein
MFKILILSLAVSIVAIAQTPDWQSIEKVFNRKGTMQGDVFKISFPRSDLKVKVGDVSIEPGLALTSWIAFDGSSKNSMMMGDLVLLDSEITPVITKLVANGLEISALHNHIVGESPSIKYLHFGGNGNPEILAQKMMSVLSVTGTPLVPQQTATTTTAYDWSKVESIIGRSGTHKGNILQFGIPRVETIIENGMNIPPFMGMATALNFQLIGEKAATTGDFVLLASEVNPVVHALIENGIAVTAIHSHMLFESPRLFFLHFWGVEQPEKLARGLRAALDKTNSEKKK